MALVICPECGKEVSDKAETCPNCGYPIGKKENQVFLPNNQESIQNLEVKVDDSHQKSNIKKIIFAVILVLFLVGAIIFGVNKYKEHKIKLAVLDGYPVTAQACGEAMRLSYNIADVFASSLIDIAEMSSYGDSILKSKIGYAALVSTYEGTDVYREQKKDFEDTKNQNFEMLEEQLSIKIPADRTELQAVKTSLSEMYDTYKIFSSFAGEPEKYDTFVDYAADFTKYGTQLENDYDNLIDACNKAK